MDKAKLQEVFSDKEYVEGIVKLSAEDAAKSLQEKGVDVTAEELIELRNFAAAHKEELQNGELSEDTLANVAGGINASGITAIVVGVAANVLALVMLCGW